MQAALATLHRVAVCTGGSAVGDGDEQQPVLASEVAAAARRAQSSRPIAEAVVQQRRLLSRLVAGNMDYLVDAVCSRVQFLDDDSAGTTVVIEFIAEHAYDAALPLLQVQGAVWCSFWCSTVCGLTQTACTGHCGCSVGQLGQAPALEAP